MGISQAAEKCCFINELLGASWYLLSIERLHTCWKLECMNEDGRMDTPSCDPRFLDCSYLQNPGRHTWLNATHVFRNCDASDGSIKFKYGMFSNALTKGIISSSFTKKYLYCLWWGLSNLSSYGSNLETSTYTGETSFCILICIMGLIIFAHLMGNMEVPFFSQMDDQLLDAICERLVSSLNTPNAYIVLEGDPVTEMLFIIRGQLESSTTDGGRSGFFNSITLSPGDFCGEELLTWALMPNSTLSLPCSTRTVRSLTEVEAFALGAEDLKFVAHQLKRLQSKKIQHAFRYYSHQWRTWGARFIQAAWRRHQKRKLAEELERQESLYYKLDSSQSAYYEYEDVLPLNDYAEASATDNQHNLQQLNATILASKFAKNTKRGVNQRRNGPVEASLKMPKLLKPNEPDFSIDAVDSA